MGTGRCLCGNVAYCTSTAAGSTLHCHCSMCRKHHGTSFGTERRFCRTCGSKTPAPAPGGSWFLPMGNLDGASHGPAMHIFAASKAPWYEITDDLPVHAAYPPGVDAPPVERTLLAARTVGAIGGSCLCGDVAFEYESEPLFMMNCHCSRCRLGRSAAHATNLFVAAEQFRWVSGEDGVTVYDLPGAARFGIDFCANCGSCVPRVSKGTGRMVIPAGTLDADPGVRPAGHIFVASKAPWFAISDGGPQFAAAAP